MTAEPAFRKGQRVHVEYDAEYTHTYDGGTLNLLRVSDHSVYAPDWAVTAAPDPRRDAIEAALCPPDHMAGETCEHHRREADRVLAALDALDAS
jgi:hypothetical protein